MKRFKQFLTICSLSVAATLAPAQSFAQEQQPVELVGEVRVQTQSAS